VTRVGNGGQETTDLLCAEQTVLTVAPSSCGTSLHGSVKPRKSTAVCRGALQGRRRHSNLDPNLATFASVGPLRRIAQQNAERCSHQRATGSRVNSRWFLVPGLILWRMGQGCRQITVHLNRANYGVAGKFLLIFRIW